MQGNHISVAYDIGSIMAPLHRSLWTRSDSKVTGTGKYGKIHQNSKVTKIWDQHRHLLSYHQMGYKTLENALEVVDGAEKPPVVLGLWNITASY